MTSLTLLLTTPTAMIISRAAVKRSSQQSLLRTLNYARQQQQQQQHEREQPVCYLQRRNNSSALIKSSWVDERTSAFHKATTRKQCSGSPPCFVAVGLLHERTMSTSTSPTKLVAVAESLRFMKDCFCAVGVPAEHAQQMADLLVAADHRGHFSHGMNRLEMYINDLSINSTDGAAVPEILKETPATAWVDGRNGLGAVVGNFCMDLAIKKAQQVGVGWVCAKGSNHYGMAGWYSLRAMQKGLVGISMTNTSPLMAPTRSKEAALGTNPLAVGAPAGENDKFLLDMATTAVAVGKIEIQRRKAEPLPHGWAQDPEGNVTTDPELAFATGCLMPLGGAEINSGYKGYGLGAMVDVLCGVMAGANYSTLVRKWTHAGANSAANLGQVFIAVDPNSFAPGFEDRMVDMNGRLRGCEPTDASKPVLVSGEKETLNMKAIDEAGGIQYLPNQLQTCEALAKRLNIQPLAFL